MSRAPGDCPDLGACLVAARPKALAALCRYFRDLDLAEDAFQEACVRALRSWPDKGRPRDEVGWLILVARNAGVDETRRRGRRGSDQPVPELPTPENEESLVEALDHGRFGDDVLRLLFLCCHPDLKPRQQIALALRLVGGLSVAEIARAFVVPPKTMEQRITRAKRKVAQAEVSFSTPTSKERRHRLAAVASVVYLIFNEGYAASGGEAHLRLPLCSEAIRLARLLLRLWPSDVELMGLLALCLLHHSRRATRLDEAGELVLLDDQDRHGWERSMIAEGSILVEKALRHRRPGPYQVQAAIAAVHARALRAADTDWAEIDRLYAVLERLQPNPVVSLNRAVAIWKVAGARAALEHLSGLGDSLSGYLPFYGVRGALRAEAGLEGAREDLETALALARTPAEKAHLRQKLEEISEKTAAPVGSELESPS